MITISVTNQKGGTGKTTSAVTLAHKLALDGYQVLLLDTDPQGHVSSTLGLEKAPGIYRLVQRYQNPFDPLLIVSARERLDVIPSDRPSTELAKRILASLDFRSAPERVLADTLEELAPKYDVAVIDCAPSVDVLHVAALVAADWLVVPTKLDYLALDGVNEVILFLEEIEQSGSSAASLLGVLPTFYERRTNETVEQLDILLDAFGDLVLPPIPTDVRLREAPAFGRTVWEYAPRTRSVVGFREHAQLCGGYARFITQMEASLWPNGADQ
jgi:chromosome partitioning protein